MVKLMAVPKFEEFFLPVLKFFEDNKIHTKVETAQYMAEYFDLDNEEMNERTSGGKALRYKDRTGWAWENKLYRNKERDKRNQEELEEMGWNVITVWECQLKKGKREQTLEKLYEQIVSAVIE